MSGMGENSRFQNNKIKKLENNKSHYSKDVTIGSELWTDGLICAFELVKGHKRSSSKSHLKIQPAPRVNGERLKKQVPTHARVEDSTRDVDNKSLLDCTSLIELGTDQVGSVNDDTDNHDSQWERSHTLEKFEGSHWVPIGWTRISELTKKVQVDAAWVSQQFDFMDVEDDRTIADLAAPYWERAAGPIWWCHVAAGHPFVDEWLNHAQWLHPAISVALRDESRLISERMKHLLYEVPVRVAGGLLFELLGQSAGDPYVDEDDIPIVLRTWQAQNFLITALHMKGSVSNVNVLGITEVQELLFAGGNNIPRTAHGVIAQLASRLARWDDRLFRKSIFGTADEVELKFINRTSREDLNLLNIILNQEIRRLSRQVIRVKWSLHAREEIIFELLQHVKGTTTRSLLEGVRKSTREMLEEQEAVRGRLFTVQDVMQSTMRAWLQDRSLRVTHNLAVFGGCGLVLSIITGLFGINVDGIPGGSNTPYAFGLFAAILFFIGIVSIALGLLYLGLKRPITEEQVENKKLELKEMVKLFQHEAETHAQVRKNVSRHNLPPTAGDRFRDDAEYILIR